MGGNVVGWSGTVRLAIGAALLRGDPAGVTSGQVADAAGRHQSNVAKMLERLIEEGLVVRVPVPPAARAPKRPGRLPRCAYALAPGQHDPLERAIASRTLPGTLHAAQQLVFAEATAERIDDLQHVLLDAAGADGVEWGAICDGERQEFLLVLEGPRAATAAADLMGQLAAAQVRCRRVTLTQLLSSTELRDHARAATRAAQRVRVRRATRRIAEGP